MRSEPSGAGRYRLEERMGTAFKLLCDERGVVFGVEAGDKQYLDHGIVPGQTFLGAQAMTVPLPNLETIRVSVPPVRIHEVMVKDPKDPLMLCCWRFVNGRWMCVPC